MEITLQLLKDLILEERAKRNKGRRKYLLRSSSTKTTVKEAAETEIVTDLEKEEERKKAEEEAEKAEEETKEDKEKKDDKRASAEEEISNLKEVEIKAPPIFEFVIGITVEKAANLDDVYAMIRAIEGVTIVSTEVEKHSISATLERAIIKAKFIKGQTPLRDYKTILGNAMLQIRGLSSINFVKVRKIAR